MDVKTKKVISLSLKVLALTISLVFGLIVLGIFIFPSYVLYGNKADHLKLSSLITEMVAIRHGVTSYCNGVADKKSGMSESQRFYYSLLSDDKGTRLSILLRNQAMKEFPINGPSAQYIDRKLDDGFPMTGKVKFTGQPSCLTQSDKNIAIYNENYDGECAAFTIEMDCKELAKTISKDSSINKAPLLNQAFEKVLWELLIVSTDDVFRDGWGTPRKIDFEERRKFFTEDAWLDYKKFVDRQKRLMQQKITQSEKKRRESLKQKNLPDEFDALMAKNKVGIKCVPNFENRFQVNASNKNEKKATANGEFMFGAYDSYRMYNDPKNQFSIEIEFYEDPKDAQNFKIQKWDIHFKDEGV